MNRFGWSVLCIAVAASVAAAAPTVERVAKTFGPPAMLVAKPAAPPKIDGKLDDPAWAAATPVVLGYVFDGWDMPSQKTEARVLADGQAIYFAVKCWEAHPEQVNVVERNDLSRINVGDTVELFLDPLNTRKERGYYRVIVGPKGAEFHRGGPDFGNWKASIAVGAGEFDGGWQVEVAVPMKELGLAEGKIPTVWGMNICRQRPELGVVRPKAAVGAARFRPSLRPLDEPEKYRDGEWSSWAPTWDDYSYLDAKPFNHPTFFGHAVLAAGTVESAPPAKVFEILYKSDLNSGEMGALSDSENSPGGLLLDESFRGPGKCFTNRDSQNSTLFLRKSLTDLEDVTMILTFRMPADGRFYYYGRAPDNWQCGAHRHEVFMTPEAAAARAAKKAGEGYSFFPPLPVYHTHADFAAWKPLGRLWKAPGGWAMMSGYFSEPTIGCVMNPGTDWAILRTRLGLFRRYHGNAQGQRLVPREQDYPRGLTLVPSAGKLLIGDVVIFRGRDVEAPQQVTGVTAQRAGEKVTVAWQRAKDNTLAAYYHVLADGKLAAETNRLSADLTAAAGKALTVVAYDLYGNASRPSEAVKAE